LSVVTSGANVTLDQPTELPLITAPDERGRSQRRERVLLALAAVFLVINFTALTLLTPERWLVNLLVLSAWFVSAVSGHWMLSQFLPRRDQLIFPLVMFLSGWGLVAITRLAPRFADRQAVWLLVATAAMCAVAILPDVLNLLRRYRYLLLLFGLVLLFSTIVFGRNPTGSSIAPQLWLGIGNVNFQPSELLKVILVVFLASYLAEQYPLLRAEGLVSDNQLLPLSPRVVGPVLLMWGLSVVVLIWQRDLGTATLFFVVFLLLLYVASGYMLVLLGGGVLIVIAAVVAYNLFDVVSLRVDIWLNPWPEADTRAFQIVQSLQAFAAGGIFGQGIGQGAPTYVPVVHSDFIFAAIAEEWGLLGVLVVIVCIGVLVMRGLLMASMHQGRPFQALLAIGLSMLLGAQSILIMGGVIRLLPLTGVTLPFLSYGGSSLLMSFVIVGLLLRLSVYERGVFFAVHR
jgi:cell division protein FtsW (lipid II flippase)